jgi:hypothetical protein
VSDYPTTKLAINHIVDGKEYILQHTNHRYRCISWYPHHVMTDWVAKKDLAIIDADIEIEKFYENN